MLLKTARVLLFSVVPALVFARGLADVAASMCGILFLIHSWRVRDFTWIRTPWVMLAFILCAYMTLSGLAADHSQIKSALNGLALVRFPLFAVAASTWVLRDETTQSRFLQCGVAFLVFVCVDTLWQFFTGTSMTGNPAPADTTRLSGPLNEVTVGSFISRMCLYITGGLFVWHAALGEKKHVQFLGILVFCALCAVTTLLSGERVALFTLGLGLIILAVGLKPYRRILLGLGVAGAIIVTSLIMINPTLHARFIGHTTRHVTRFSDSSYGHILHNSMVAWRSAPVMGIGPKNFYDTCVRGGPEAGYKTTVLRHKFTCARHTHNYYLQFLVEGGLVGLGLFLSLVFVWLRDAWARRGAVWGVATLAWLVPALWPVASTMGFFGNWNAVIFWLGIGLSYLKINEKIPPLARPA